jgi:hypothetical protein
MGMTGPESLERLARVLQEKMEDLDPCDGREWDELTDHEREFYRQCVKHILMERKHVLCALPLADNDPILRSAEPSE